MMMLSGSACGAVVEFRVSSRSRCRVVYVWGLCSCHAHKHKLTAHSFKFSSSPSRCAVWLSLSVLRVSLYRALSFCFFFAFDTHARISRTFLQMR